MSQLRKRVHLFNCDNTYGMEPVQKLLDEVKKKLLGQFSIHVECIERHSFRLSQISEMVDRIPTLEMDMAFFVVHAHESRLSINEDNAGIGYAEIYRALLQATEGDVIIVIGGDDNYKGDDEENREVISRWATRKVSSQFVEEYLDGRQSFVFSWNKQHRVVHEQALLHHFDPNKKGQKFEFQPPPSNQKSSLEPQSQATTTELENPCSPKSYLDNSKPTCLPTVGTVTKERSTDSRSSTQGSSTDSAMIEPSFNNQGDGAYTPNTHVIRTSSQEPDIYADSSSIHLQNVSGNNSKSPRGESAQSTPQPVLATQIPGTSPSVVLLRGICHHGKIPDRLDDLQVWDPEFNVPDDIRERLHEKHCKTPEIGVRIIRRSNGIPECQTYRDFKAFSLDGDIDLFADEKLLLKTRVHKGKVSFQNVDVEFKFANLHIPQKIIDGFTQKTNGDLYIISDGADNFRCIVKSRSVGKKATELFKRELHFCRSSR